MILSQKKKIYLRNLFIIIISIFLVIYRKQDSILNAQFFAEDGTYWFAQANNIGFKSLFIPIAGYFQSNSRIIALISTYFDYAHTPIIFNFYALSVQILPIILLLSNRYKKISIQSKLFSIFIYIFLFNTSETYLNVTNAQWYLAISMSLIIFSNSKKISNSIFDLIIVLISGLSGPFSILLLASIFLRKKFHFEAKEKVLFLTAFVQLFSLFILTNGSRSSFLTQINIFKIYDVWWRQVLWGLIAGPVGYSWLIEKLKISYNFLQLFSLSGLYILLFALLRSKTKIKKAIIFSILIFLSSVIIPTVSPSMGKTALEILFDSYGLRYWLIPMLGFYLSLIWGITQKNKVVKIISCFYIFLLIGFSIKIYHNLNNFKFPAFEDYQYSRYINDFNNLPVGGQIVIPINPVGWKMKLNKTK
jgi:hypothetical protein